MASRQRRGKPRLEEKQRHVEIEQPSAVGGRGGRDGRLHFYRRILCLLLTLAGIAGVPYVVYKSYHRVQPSAVPIEGIDTMFEVVELPGKGKGVIATRRIEQGELIIWEKPLFVVPHQINSSPAALISQSLRQVSLSGRQAFLNLSYVNFPKNLNPEEHPDELALAIFQTNAVAAGDAVGIFPHMARLNHGCSSAFNVVYSWRESEGVIVVYALKNIQKGEELLTTYTNTKRPRDQRRAFLKNHYGFLCSCSVCSLSEAQSRLSDERLTGISDAYDRFATWGSHGINGIESIEIVRAIWKLEDEEGYWSERGRLAADAAWVAASHADATATREWARLAIKWYTYELGGDSELILEMEEALRDPTRHSAWGSREPLAVGGPGGPSLHR